MFTMVASRTTMSWASETTTSTSQRCGLTARPSVAAGSAIRSVATVDVSLREIGADGVEQRHQLNALRGGEGAEDLVHRLHPDGDGDLRGLPPRLGELDD